MAVPATAAKTTIHRGMMSGFTTTSLGIACVNTSWLLTWVNLLSGLPMYGSLVTLADIVELSVTGLFSAT
jgi:hypothetical protein